MKKLSDGKAIKVVEQLEKEVKDLRPLQDEVKKERAEKAELLADFEVLKQELAEARKALVKPSYN